MKRMFLAAMPIILFVGAMLSFTEPHAQPQPPPRADYQPAPPAAAPGAAPEAVSGNQSLPQPPPPPPQQPAHQKTFVTLKVCSDGAGTTAYEYNGTLQIQPAGGKSPQCGSPLAVVEDGIRYFGCGDGSKVILDCDWFAQRIGDESAGFGGSSLADFSAPNVSGFSCADGLVDQALLLKPQGKICDFRTLAGNIGQATSRRATLYSFAAYCS